MKGVPFQSKLKRVYERVRDWTSGRSLSAEKVPPPFHLLRDLNSPAGQISTYTPYFQIELILQNSTTRSNTV